MPTLILPPQLVSLFDIFAPCFTEPGFQYFAALLVNLMAGTGRRSAASAYARSAVSGHWSNLVRWLSRKRKDSRRPSIAQVLLSLLLSHLPLPVDNRGRRRLLIVVDETRVSKSKGATTMDHLQYWYNPHGGSCLGRYIWGHLWAVVGVLLPIGCNGRLRCFPITGRLCPPKDKPQKSKNDISYTTQAFFQSLESIDWSVAAHDCLPMLIGDTTFSCRAFLNWTHDNHFFLLSRVSLNADVREILWPVPEGQRKRGRPRRWGDRIDLEQVFADDSLFQPLPTPLYERKVQASYTSLIGVLKRSGHVVRVVLVKAEHYKPCAIICTDLSLDPTQIVSIYTDRFEMEIAIRELKDETGFGHYQVRRQHAIERHAQISILACALLKLLRARPQLLGLGSDVAAQTLPWKPHRDSFSTPQVRTLLQQACMAQYVFRVLAAAGVNAKKNRLFASMRALRLGTC